MRSDRLEAVGLLITILRAAYTPQSDRGDE